MLSDSELEQLFEKFDVPAVGRGRIRWIRQNAPVRRVNGSGVSQSIRYCGRTMNFVIEAEAISTEFATIVTFDHCESILELYHQPCRLKISWKKSNGSRGSTQITPDLFCISRNGFFFVECKNDQKLFELNEKDSARFTLGDDGKWHSPPAEAAAKEFGCDFVIRASSENNWVLVENLEFLKDYYIHPSEVPADELEKLRSRFLDKAWCSIHELIEGESPHDADVVYNSIVKKHFYFSLIEHRLTKPEDSYLFRDELSAHAYKIYLGSQSKSSDFQAEIDIRPGCVFSWDGRTWEVVNVGDLSVASRCLDLKDATLINLTYAQIGQLARDGKIVSANLPHSANAEDPLKKCSTKDLQVAIWRHEIIRGRPSDDNPLVNSKPRTIAYWKSNWKKAEVRHGYGFVGLVRNINKTQGNHDRKVDEGTLDLIRELHPVHWENSKQKNYNHFLGAINNECDRRGLGKISIKTLRNEVKRQETIESKEKREGKKRAYQSEIIQFWHLEFTTPAHGTHPFHIAHIDHTPFDVRLVNSRLETIVKTATLSLLIDAFSRKILAWYLSFDKPSYISCMMVLRDCVRRHGRFPQRIVSDGGKEFFSVYYEKLMAFYYVDKQNRKKGKPRDGSVIERMFRLTQEQFAHGLLGNTQAEKHWRQVSPEVNPVKLANWTLNRLCVRLEEYFNVYHDNFHTTLGCTPNQMFMEGLRVSGKRKNAFINFDKNFIVNTMPATAKGDVKVNNRGVKVNYIYYTGPVLNDYSVIGKRLEVRYDPLDAGHVYVYINNEWQECFSEFHHIFKGIGVRLLGIASEILRQKYRMAGKEYEITAERLAEFIESVEHEEKMAIQAMHDSEVGILNSSIGQNLLVTDVLPNKVKQDDVGEENTPPNILEIF